MADLGKMSKQARSAAMRGGTDGWGQHGSADQHIRYMEPVEPTSRRRCPCGCKGRATHKGMANGVALLSGCEFRVRKWVTGGNRG